MGQNALRSWPKQDHARSVFFGWCSQIRQPDRLHFVSMKVHSVQPQLYFWFLDTLANPAQYFCIFSGYPSNFLKSQAMVRMLDFQISEHFPARFILLEHLPQSRRFCFATHHSWRKVLRCRDFVDDLGPGNQQMVGTNPVLTEFFGYRKLHIFLESSFIQQISVTWLWWIWDMTCWYQRSWRTFLSAGYVLFG